VTQTFSVGLTELEQAGRLRLETPACPVLVALVEGTPYAVQDACRHRQASLATGVIRDGVVTCPSHFFQYDLRTGARHDNEGEPLPAYPARIVGDRVEVEVPDAVRAPSLREVLLAHAREAAHQ
jgi:nitrite reductase/ring-hydroxylating ferredoxin subunit